MAADKFYNKSDCATDTHTLYVKCDCATEEQIRNAFLEAIEDYNRRNPTDPIECRLRVNVIENQKGTAMGSAFVFLTNSAVYYMLLRKNPDGSDRISYKDDPSWTPPAAGKLTNDAGWSTIASPITTSNTSWFDMCQMEEEMMQVKQEVETRICPKIAVQLDPLMILPKIKLTPEQVQKKRQKIIDENKDKIGFKESLVGISEYANLCINRAEVYGVDQKFMAHILKCKNLPSWITRDDLKVQFAPYASDSKTIHERYIRGGKIEEPYPFVNINDDGVAFIIFDPSTRDAQFALHMMKKTKLTKTMPDGTVRTAILFFGHSYRTDRDMMADITQQPRVYPLPAARSTTSIKKYATRNDHRKSNKIQDYTGRPRKESPAPISKKGLHKITPISKPKPSTSILISNSFAALAE